MENGAGNYFQPLKNLSGQAGYHGEMLRVFMSQSSFPGNVLTEPSLRNAGNTVFELHLSNITAYVREGIRINFF